MTLRVRHAKVAVSSDSGDGKVSSNAWNDDHVLSGTANMVLGFDSNGEATEIDPSTFASAASSVADRTALAALSDTSRPIYLREAGREGMFVFNSSDLSAEVTADHDHQGIYVPATTDTTGASGAWVRHPGIDTWVHAKWFGVSATSSDNYAALNGARAVASLLKRTLLLPDGTLTVNQAAPNFPLDDGEQIVGPGESRTTLYFTGLGAAGEVFTATGKSGIRLSGFKMAASELQVSGQVAMSLRDCIDCDVEDIVFDKWTNNAVFWQSANLVPPQAINLRNSARRCVSLSSRSYAFFMDFATACEFVDCYAYNVSNQDGFKAGGGSYNCKIDRCHAVDCNGDGFDTYDGFIASTLSNCTSFSNTSNGFQLKGTLGGTYTAGDYVTRESTYSNLIAANNGLAGFLMQEMRLGTASNLIATGNGTSGFILNNVQGMSLSSCLADRNTQHGWSLIGNTSRCTFSSCSAIDNSYVDGTTQNGTYDGWNFGAAPNNYFSNCYSGQGTQAGKLGGQGYGFNLLTSSGNHFVGGGAGVNVTGAVGGTNPFTNNTFVAFDASGTFISVPDASITLAKIQNASANSKLLGSGATGSGAPYSEITLGTGLSMSGTTLSATGGGGLSDGDKGDIVVSGTGATWTIDSSVLTTAGRALIDDVDTAAQRTTLGLGTAATQASTAFAPAAPQIQAVTSSATVTPTFSNDQVNITAQAVGLTLANPSGTAVDGWGIVIRIKDNGSSQSIAYGTQYRAVGVTLPTATAAGKVHYLGCVWNAAATKLDVLAVAQEA